MGRVAPLLVFAGLKGTAQLLNWMALRLSLTMKMWASRANYMVMRVLSQAPLLFTQ